MVPVTVYQSGSTDRECASIPVLKLPWLLLERKKQNKQKTPKKHKTLDFPDGIYV